MKNKLEQSFEQELKKRFVELNSSQLSMPVIDPGIKQKYLLKIKQLSNKPVSKSSVSRLTLWNNILHKEFRMGTIATIMIILGLVLGGTSATAYAAQDDLPNQFLYPVKLLTEDIQSGLTTNTQAKLDLALEFAETRINEIIQLKEEGLVPPEPVYANLEMQIQNAIMLSTQLGENNLEPALLQIRDRLQIQEQLMDKDDQSPTLLRTRTLLQERIQLIDTGLANLNGFYYEAQNGWENTPLMNQGENQNIKQQNQNQEQAPGNNQGPNLDGTTNNSGTVISTPTGNGVTTGGTNNPGYGYPTTTPKQNGSGKK